MKFSTHEKLLQSYLGEINNFQREYVRVYMINFALNVDTEDLLNFSYNFLAGSKEFLSETEVITSRGVNLGKILKIIYH